MTTSIMILPSLPIILYCLLFLPYACSTYFQISRFDTNAANILFQGDAVASVGAIELINKRTYLCRAGLASYAERVLLWDSHTRKLTDFTTHFSFIIDTGGLATYGNGIAFFLAPVGFQIPPNSAGGFLGLFNTTTSDFSGNQIVLVEFDSYVNTEWDPPYQHVGINKNSIASVVTTPWNASLHSGDTTDVWIIYNATTKNLSVHWSYQTTSSATENSSISYQIDLMKILPEWVTIGFSAGTGQFGERNTLVSWEFNSTLKEASVKHAKWKRLVLIVGLPVCCVVIAGVIIALVLWKRRIETPLPDTEHLTSINEDLERGAAGPRRFSFPDLVTATNNFSNDRKLGEGGSGEVYRGHLIESDTAVAVKKISSRSGQGRKEYITEVKVISSLRHRNLVQLKGWCHDEGDGQFLLVYEFMPNGSLDSHLFGKSRSANLLPWDERYKISQGLASALLYLHEGWNRQQCVLHRDVKSSNILLDSSFDVKLGDFGLARLMDHELGPQTTGLAGTRGYLAPEYISTGKASKESDIYSFGVVALEIATGKKSLDPMTKDSEMGLVEWVWDHYGKEKLFLAVDERLQHLNYDKKQVERLMIVGLWCAHPDRSKRPSIRRADQVLNFEAELPILPKQMPVPVYREPTAPPSVSSGEPLSMSSLQEGR